MNLKLEFESFQAFASALWPCLTEEAMWVQAEDPAGVGEVVEFDVTLADGFRLFHGTGHVVSIGPGPADGPSGQGMMISFDHLDRPSRNLIRKVVSKHLAEGGTKFEPRVHSPKVELVGAEDPLDVAETAVEEFSPDLESAGEEPDEGSAVEEALTGVVEPAGSGGGDDGGVELEEEGGDDEAPYVDLESDGWTGEVEPELTSFLKPREDLAAGAAALGAETTDLRGNLEAGAGVDDASIDDVAESSDEFLGALEEAEARSEGLFGGSGDLQEDVASSYVPPAPSTMEPPPVEGDRDDAPPPPVEEPVDEWEEAPARAAWWPWVVIAVLGVGAGLFFARQFGLGGWGPTREEVQAADRSAAVAVEEASEPSTTGSPAATTTAVETDPAGESVTVVDAGSEAERADDEAMPEDVAAATADDVAEVVPALPPVADSLPTSAAPPTSEEVAAAPQVADAPAAPPIDPVRLERITWRRDGADTVVSVHLDRPIGADRVESIPVTSGVPRHVVKIDGIAGRVPPSVAIGSGQVDQLRFGKHLIEGGMQLHVVADLSSDQVAWVAPVAFDGATVHLRFAAR